MEGRTAERGRERCWTGRGEGRRTCGRRPWEGPIEMLFFLFLSVVSEVDWGEAYGELSESDAAIRISQSTANDFLLPANLQHTIL